MAFNAETRVRIASRSASKRAGIEASLTRALGASPIFHHHNPEEFQPELESSDISLVALSKRETVRQTLAPEHAEDTTISVDVGTFLYMAGQSQPYQLHRPERQLPNSTNPEDLEVNQQNVMEKNRSNYVLMCCQGNFMIEWHIGYSVYLEDGKLDRTYEAVARAYFNPLDVETVAQMFDSQDGQPAKAWNYGPGLPLAEWADSQAEKIELVEGETTLAIDGQELYRLVVNCQLPAIVLAEILAAFYAEEQELIN